MKKLRESKAMQDDLIRCVSMVGFGIYFAAFSGVSQWQRNLAIAGLVSIIVMSLLELWQIQRNTHMTPEEKRTAQRENSDERSQMIQDRAMRDCWSLEDALLIIAILVCVFRGRLDVCGVLYPILAIRELACVALRWWLERKY